METFSVNDLKKSEKFPKQIRWDITPKIFFSPVSAAAGNKPVNINGYMLYVDLVNDKPILMIMRNRTVISRTVGYIEDVPEDLLKEALNCTKEGCIGGMTSREIPV
ncbi:MAG: hypothetical protein Q7U68_01105 [Candidatus Roizmanbacteria bacterium]|nr:hypothetical protein [Candidatus Roizmanbacteria bacterium]